ncbi:MAG: hypothetical protein ACRDGU_03910 [Actinomycetota bacterium]
MTLDDLHRFTIDTLDRVVADYPLEFGYDQVASSGEGDNRIVFSRKGSACRRIAFNFDTREGILDVFQLTSAHGDPLEAERPPRRVDPAAPGATAEIVDVVCWVLVGAADAL